MDKKKYNTLKKPKEEKSKAETTHGSSIRNRVRSNSHDFKQSTINKIEGTHRSSVSSVSSIRSNRGGRGITVSRGAKTNIVSTTERRASTVEKPPQTEKSSNSSRGRNRSSSSSIPNRTSRGRGSNGRSHSRARSKSRARSRSRRRRNRGRGGGVGTIGGSGISRGRGRSVIAGGGGGGGENQMVAHSSVDDHGNSDIGVPIVELANEVSNKLNTEYSDDIHEQNSNDLNDSLENSIHNSNENSYENSNENSHENSVNSYENDYNDDGKDINGPDQHYVHDNLAVGDQNDYYSNHDHKNNNDHKDSINNSSNNGVIDDGQHISNGHYNTNHVEENGKTEDQEDDVFGASVHQILSELTSSEKLESVVSSFNDLAISTADRLYDLVALVFYWSLEESELNLTTYAQLCSRLSIDLPKFIIKPGNLSPQNAYVDEEVTFKKLLLNQFQSEFEKEKDDMSLQRQNRLIILIGELYVHSVLESQILMGCVVVLLGDVTKPREGELEALCWLLKIAGKKLYHEHPKFIEETVFEKLKMIARASSLPSRLRFCILDVVEFLKKSTIIMAPILEKHGFGGDEKKEIKKKN